MSSPLERSEPTLDAGVPRLAVRGLCKDFARGLGRATVFSVVRDALTAGRSREDPLHALSDINFEAHDGQVIGVVGSNGAGKTTLLKVIAGLYLPTSGEVEVRGELALMSGLGVGMIPDLTVRENVYLYGAVCRLDNNAVDEVFDDIIAWAELGDFVGTPFRNLSAGMRTRLAFSITRHVQASVILLDEAESAGDRRFVGKVEQFFRERDRDHNVVVISSHSLEFIQDFCDKAIWLQHGTQVASGPTDVVVGRYLEWVAEGTP